MQNSVDTAIAYGGIRRPEPHRHAEIGSVEGLAVSAAGEDGRRQPFAGICEGPPAMSRENADLERRVLAHEQILQALIAYMVESDPEVLKRMTAAFSNPVRLDEEKDYTDTATYAARFIREIIRLGYPQESPSNVSLMALWDDLWPTSGEKGLLNENVPVRFEIAKRDDLWEVLRDGRLIGGYVAQDGALQAAQEAMHGIFCGGGSAELIARQGPR